MRKSIVASLLLAPSLAFASGYALPNPNTRDLGVCASAVAAQRDAGATLAMPAALARIEGPSVTLGSDVVNVFDTWKDPTPGATLPPPTEPGKEDLKIRYTPVPTGAVSYGGKLPFLGNRGWGAGIAFQPFGGAIVNWADDWAGRYRITKVDRRTFSGLAVAAIEVIPQVRLGGGFVYYYTTEKFTQKLFTTPLGGPGDVAGTLDLSGGAASFDLSAEIEPLPGVPLTIAADYKHKATQKLDGDVSFSPAFSTGVPPFSALFSSTSAKETLTVPNRLNVGISYRVMKPLLLTGTYTFERWVVYDRDLFVSNTGFSIDVPRDYSNGHTIRVGAEYDLNATVQLRAGLQRDISGLKKSTYSPTLPDESSWAGSLGATYKFARGVYVDAGVFYAIMDKVTAENPAPVEPAPGDPRAFRGTYEPSALIYGLSVGWTPGAPHGG